MGQLLKEQNEYDQMPSSLCDRVQRIVPLAKKVSDEIVSEETEILKELIPRMFEVMHRVAKLSCDYVKRGKWSSLSVRQVLMIAARTIGGPAYPEMMEEMDRELTKVIEDFDRAMTFEALRLANETSKPSFSQPVDSWSSAACCRANRARASRTRASRTRASGARFLV